MLGKPGILSIFPNLLNKFNKTRELDATHVRFSIYSMLRCIIYRGLDKQKVLA